MQELLVKSYTKQFEKQHDLFINISNDIISIIYSFYTKQRMINEWIISDLVNYSKHRTIRKAIHFKTEEIITLTYIKISKDNPLIITDSKKHKIMREFHILQQLNHPNVISAYKLDFNASKIDHEGNKAKCILFLFKFKYFHKLFDMILFIGHLDESSTKSYFLQLINALHAIHELDITLYKLNDEYLFLDHNFNLKLMIETDTFKVEEKKYSIDPMMKPKWRNAMRNNINIPQKKSKNIFQCGILLFAMYAGFPPFQDDVDTDWWWDKLSKGWKYLVASEKQKYQKDRDKHVAAAAKKIGLFWKAHERSRKFSDDLKNIIINMLHPYYEYRYKYNDIINHEWYQQQNHYELVELQQYMKHTLIASQKKHEQDIKEMLITVMDETKTINKEEMMRLDPFNEFEINMSELKDELLINYGIFQFMTNVHPLEIASRLKIIAMRSGCTLNVLPQDNVIFLRCSVSFRLGGNNDEDIIISCKQFHVNEAYLVRFCRIKVTTQINVITC